MQTDRFHLITYIYFLTRLIEIEILWVVGKLRS